MIFTLFQQSNEIFLAVRKNFVKHFVTKITKFSIFYAQYLY